MGASCSNSPSALQLKSLGEGDPQGKNCRGGSATSPSATSGPAPLSGQPASFLRSWLPSKHGPALGQFAATAQRAAGFSETSCPPSGTELCRCWVRGTVPPCWQLGECGLGSGDWLRLRHRWSLFSPPPSPPLLKWCRCLEGLPQDAEKLGPPLVTLCTQSYPNAGSGYPSIKQDCT